MHCVLSTPCDWQLLSSNFTIGVSVGIEENESHLINNEFDRYLLSAILIWAKHKKNTCIWNDPNDSNDNLQDCDVTVTLRLWRVAFHRSFVWGDGIFVSFASCDRRCMVHRAHWPVSFFPKFLRLFPSNGGTQPRFQNSWRWKKSHFWKTNSKFSWMLAVMENCVIFSFEMAETQLEDSLLKYSWGTYRCLRMFSMELCVS